MSISRMMLGTIQGSEGKKKIDVSVYADAYFIEEEQ